MCRGYRELFTCCGEEKTIAVEYCSNAFQDPSTGEKKACGPEPTEDDRVVYSDPPYAGTWSCDVCKRDTKLKEPWAAFKELSIETKKRRQPGVLERKDGQAKAMSEMEAQDKAVEHAKEAKKIAQEAKQAEMEAKVDTFARPGSRRGDNSKPVQSRENRTADCSTERKPGQSVRKKSVSFSERPPSIIGYASQSWTETKSKSPKIIEIAPRHSTEPKNTAYDRQSTRSSDRVDGNFDGNRPAHSAEQTHSGSHSKGQDHTDTTHQKLARLTDHRSSRLVEQKPSIHSTEERHNQSSSRHGSIREYKEYPSTGRSSSTAEQKPTQSAERGPNTYQQGRRSSATNDRGDFQYTEFEPKYFEGQQRSQSFDETPVFIERAPKTGQPPERIHSDNRNSQQRHSTITGSQKLQLSKSKGALITHATVQKSSDRKNSLSGRDALEQARAQHEKLKVAASLPRSEQRSRTSEYRSLTQPDIVEATSQRRRRASDLRDQVRYPPEPPRSSKSTSREKDPRMTEKERLAAQMAREEVKRSRKLMREKKDDDDGGKGNGKGPERERK